MFHRLRERCNRLLAEALPSRLAYWAAKRVLAHAALTRYREAPTVAIGALEALDHWEDSMLPQRVARSLARLREPAPRPSGAPLWKEGPGGTLRPRDVAPGERLESVDADALESVQVVSELRPAAAAKAGQGA